MTGPEIGGFEVGATGPLELVRGEAPIQVARVQHELFGVLLAPQRPTDLARLLRLITEPSMALGWRGQAKLGWRIDTALARRVRHHRDQLAGAGGGDLEGDVRAAERALLSRARLAGHDRRDGRTLSDLELSAVLQHHGAATRLLDCTANAYVALWFACREAESEYGLLTAFDLGQAWHVHSADLLGLSMDDLLGHIPETFASWRPSALSPRIAAQQGIFVFSGAIDQPWGSVRFRGEALERTGSVPGLYLFAISPALKRTMRGLWAEMFGYTDETLFPDLDGFARVHRAIDEFPEHFLDSDPAAAR
jgi:hypothetical protein